MKMRTCEIICNFTAFALISVSLIGYCLAEHFKNDVCSQSCQSSMNGSYVAEFCEENSLQLKERCCVNNTGSQIVGIDLQGCDLSKLTGLFEQQPALQVILLQDNPISNVTSSDFQGLLRLEYLALPPGHSCPGGSEAWEAINATANQTLCLHEEDYCQSHNVSCPANSDCINTGPGINECLCSPGYHGYKCLRQGTFPTLLFTSGMVGSVLVVSGFLWITQRRHVKKNV